MQRDSKIYVGQDTSKLKISVAAAEPGRDGEVRFVGDIDSAPEAVERLVTRLARLHRAGELTAVWVPDPDTRRYENWCAPGRAQWKL